MKNKQSAQNNIVPPGLREKAASLAYKAGRYDEAAKLSAECLQINPKDQAQILLFSLAARDAVLKSFDATLKNAAIACLQSHNVEHQKIFPLWAFLLATDPLHKHLNELGQYFSFEDFKNALDWKKLQSSLEDQFFLLGLKAVAVTRFNYERALTHLRRWMLEAAAENTNAVRQKHLPFLCALAEHCHYNEYVFYISEDEEALIEKLAQDPWSDPVKTALLACYRPLYDFSETMPGKPHPALKDLIKTQIEDRAEELRLMKELPSAGTIHDETSKAVQAMYEENPYPRWQTVDVPVTVHRNVKGDYLIAGCGTGRTATQTPMLFPNLNITAIDITRRSLSYAMRKSNEYGVKNMRFVHCDILELEKLDGQFDVIECGGVLHHMKDPVAGWKQLIKKLKPGGAMLIGLYSTLARKDYKAAQDYVAGKAIPSTPDGIRRFRRELVFSPGRHPLAPLQAQRNFYTLSECRDLIFHIQETTYTIPELRKIMDELGLSFLGFRLDSPQKAAIYRQVFPQDPDMLNLDNWEALEKKIPGLFLSMYQFICCRRGEESTPCLGLENIKKSGFFRDNI